MPFVVEASNELRPSTVAYQAVGVYRAQAQEVEVRRIEEQRTEHLDERRPFLDGGVHRLVDVQTRTRLAVEVVYTVTS
jgi:hypothetical protein